LTSPVEGAKIIDMIILTDADFDYALEVSEGMLSACAGCDEEEAWPADMVRYHEEMDEALCPFCFEAAEDALDS
jgi:hypothetical protein